DPDERPVVGDFVEIEQSAPPKITRVLPRRGALTRAAAGERYVRQIIATNIDVVFVLTGLDHDFNPARIERYLALIEGSGAQPVIVLTKADKLESSACADALAQLASRLPDAVPMHAINAKDPASVVVLNPYLASGISAVLVGSSGAGKSTLTNTLLGEARMATAATRASDGRGRHTTSYRALLLLPSGACLIDTPGMRELKLTGEENLEVFADIDALVTQCRFADCGHGNEPDCAVRAALDSGELDPARWRHYLKLRGEHDAQAAQIEERMRRDEIRSASHKQRHLTRDRERR
ncbi:MAG: ribosome small subunit-dependent GTPase A, partial [Pseudomonadota bacterium]|nr:ribosome small subunit-dependent GTPase A [Pseudomonadota bacterium]